MRFMALVLLVLGFGSVAQADTFAVLRVKHYSGISHIVITPNQSGFVNVSEFNETGSGVSRISSQKVATLQLSAVDQQGNAGIVLGYVYHSGYVSRLIQCKSGSTLFDCDPKTKKTYYVLDVRDECGGSSEILEQVE